MEELTIAEEKLLKCIADFLKALSPSLEALKSMYVCMYVYVFIYLFVSPVFALSMSELCNCLPSPLGNQQGKSIPRTTGKTEYP